MFDPPDPPLSPGDDLQTPHRHDEGPLPKWHCRRDFPSVSPPVGHFPGMQTMYHQPYAHGMWGQTGVSSPAGPPPGLPSVKPWCGDDDDGVSEISTYSHPFSDPGILVRIKNYSPAFSYINNYFYRV